MSIIIPDNDHDIVPGNYSVNEFVQLLRDHCAEPDTVTFLADMMEQ